MRKLLLGLSIFTLALVPASAGQMSLLGAGKSAAAAGYAGPVDVISANVVECWSTRACTNALIGTNAVELRESGGNTTQTFATVAGGGLNLAAIATFKGANNLFVRTLYGQISGINFVQSTNALQPAFILSGLGSLPVIRFVRANGNVLTATLGGAQAQPFSISSVGIRTGSFTSGTIGGSVVGTPVTFGYRNQANFVNFYAGSGRDVAATDSAWHALLYVFNSAATSAISVDATYSTTVSNGTNSMPAAIAYGDASGQGDNLDGDQTEFILYSDAKSSGDATALCHNQFLYFGTSTSC